MTYIIFGIAAAALVGIARLTGLTYCTVNILVYYLLIPLSWAYMIDKIIQWPTPWLTLIWVAVWFVIFFGTKGHFQSWCDWAFDRSVVFLNWFRVFKWNYYVASVYICVWLPLIIYAILAGILCWQHPWWHWQPLVTGIVSILVLCWALWWSIMTFAVKLEPRTTGTGVVYSFSEREKNEINRATEGMSENQIVDYAMKYTCHKLDLVFKSYNTLKEGEGNCMIYSSMLTAVANQAFTHNHKKARAHHDVGNIKFLGQDLGKIASSVGEGLFSDHDFVTISTSDGLYSIDPSFKELLGYDLKTNRSL